MDATEQFRIWLRYSRVTAALIAISVVVGLLSGLGSNYSVLRYFLISEYGGGLPEIFSGQVWRLVTPIFIHFGILHIVFNLWWLYDLGSVVEQRQGPRRMIVLVLVTAALSNLAEYFWSGPGFGGMSGVVYSLLAYVWVQGELNPRAGLGLHQNIVLMMGIWFVVCWLGLVGNVANMAHTAGILVGAGLGAAYSPYFWRRLKR